MRSNPLSPALWSCLSEPLRARMRYPFAHRRSVPGACVDIDAFDLGLSKLGLSNSGDRRCADGSDVAGAAANSATLDRDTRAGRSLSSSVAVGR